MTWDEGTPTIGRIFSEQLEELLGPARDAGRRADRAPRGRRRVAAGACSRRSTCTSSTRCAARTGCRELCLAGGVALNAVANGRIRPETPFEEVYVQPAAGDAGTAIGAALYVWHQVLGAAARLRDGARLLGTALRRRRVRRGARGAPGSTRERLDDERARRRTCAERIADGRRGRLVPGPDGVRPARAGQPLDRRRPAPRRT